MIFDNVIELRKVNAIDLGEKGCDEYGVYKDLGRKIINIELIELIFTKYNYHSLTNIINSKIKVYYSDNTTEEMLLNKLPNLEVLNYNPSSTNEQDVTIKTAHISMDIKVTNPSIYESGWEYNVLDNGNIELTGYKSHDFDINRLYIPETIDSKKSCIFCR